MNKRLHIAFGIPTAIYAFIIIFAKATEICWEEILHSTMFSYFLVFGTAELLLIIRGLCKSISCKIRYNHGKIAKETET